MANFSLSSKYKHTDINAVEEKTEELFNEIKAINPDISEQQASGETITLEKVKRIEVEKINFKSEQSDTPTPEAPQEITTVGNPIIETSVPNEFRVPTDEDWTNFTNYVNNYQSTPPDYDYRYNNTDGAIAKSLANTSGWNSSGTAGHVGNDQASNNATGFSGKPAGLRNSLGSFFTVGSYGYWWSSSPSGSSAWGRNVRSNRSDVLRGNSGQGVGNSVRLVRDDTSSDVDGTIYEDDYTGNDGKKYNGIKIGDFVWLAENLKETKYADGTTIPEITDNTDWANDTTGARCLYDNDTDNLDEYGYLYNFFALDGIVNPNSTYEIDLPTDFVGGSLPNETADTIEKVDGEYKAIQRLEKAVLDGSEEWEDGEEDYTYILPSTSTPNTADDIRVISNKIQSVKPSELEDETEAMCINEDGDLVVKTNRASTLAGFETWLGANNLTTYYETTEQEHEVVVPEIVPTGDETTITTTNDVKPFLVLNYSTNTTDANPIFKTNWTAKDFPYLDEIDRVKQNITDLTKYFIRPYAWNDLELQKRFFDFRVANKLEINLQLIEEAIARTQIKYSGESYINETIWL